MKKRVLGIVLGCGLSLSSAAVFAAVDLSATELLKVNGKVEVKKGADAPFKPVPANLKLAGALKRLDTSDKVKTRESSLAEMVLKDTCVMEVKENSLFEVPGVLGQAALGKLRAQQGSFLFKVVTGSNFQVQTADVIAGVKGTLFEVEVVDSLKALLHLPGFDVGTENVGGSMVNVYDGQVELTHASTGKKRLLKKGEGLAVLNRLLMGLDKSFADGFGPLQKIDPVRLLQERFGEVGTRLAAIPSTVQGITGFSGEGLQMPSVIGKPFERVNQLVQGFAGPVVDRIRQVRERAAPLQELSGLAKDLKGTAFHPTFDASTYPVLPIEETLAEGVVQETCLANGLFMAVTPIPGKGDLTLQKEKDGQGLGAGDGTFHLRDFVQDLDAYVTVQTQGSNRVTTIQVNKGTLYARMADEFDLIPITAGRPVGLEFDTTTGKGRRMPVAAAVTPAPVLSSYRFKVEDDIDAQRTAHQQKEGQKRQDALGKVVDKVKKGGKIKIPKFW